MNQSFLTLNYIFVSVSLKKVSLSKVIISFLKKINKRFIFTYQLLLELFFKSKIKKEIKQYLLNS